MKKFLSLALALVMTMSMVTISASADFADDASISYAEAVDVMAELDIIGGYADGSFAPTGTLTRGAAAKIICNMILGPTTADALSASAAPFPDVAADHTFAAYIAYCAQQGIISGYADGNFYPAGTVTAYQFMKMLLGALGYDSDIEGFTGDNWSINVAKLAISMGLDDGNEDFVGTTAMTREEACLYAFNTLCADMVEYPNNTSVVVGDVSITTSSSASVMENFGSTDGNIADDYEMQFAEKYFTNLNGTEGDNDFGQPVTTWKIKSSSIGTYINNDELVAEYEGKVTEATLYSLIDDEAAVVVYVDGTDDIWAEGEDLFTKNSSSAAAGTGNGSLTYVYEIDDDDYVIVTKNTYLVQAADDYDADDEILKISELDDMNYAYTTADSATDDNITVDVQSYIEDEDVDVEDFVEDDYILVTIANGDIKSAALAEVISGTVTTYTNNSSVTVDGEKYSYSLKLGDKYPAYAIDEDTVLVLDAQGYAIYVSDLIVNSDRYVFVDAFDYSSSFSSATIYAAAYFSDGTYAEIQLDEIYGVDADDYYDGDIDALASFASTWYTYTTNSDGSYDLTTVEDDYFNDSDYKTYTNLKYGSNKDVVSNGYVTFASGGTDNGSTYGSTATSIKGDSSTIFIVVDEDDDVYAFTGIANVPDVTTGAGESASVYALLDGSYADFVFIDARDADVDGASASAADYLFALKTVKVTTDSNGDKIYDYEALVDGEIIEISATNDVDYYSAMTGELYYDVTEDASGYIDGGKVFSDKYTTYNTSDDAYYYSVSNTTASVSGDVLDFSKITDMDFYMSDDSVAYMIVAGGVSALLSDDGADYEVEEYSTAKSLYNDLKDYTFDADIFMVADDDGSETVVALYVYVTDAVKDGVTSSGSELSDGVEVDTVSASALYYAASKGLDIPYYVEAGTYDLTEEDMTAILEAAGATEVFVVLDEDTGNYDIYYTINGKEVVVDQGDITFTQYYVNTYAKATLSGVTVEVEDASTIVIDGKSTETGKTTVFAITASYLDEDGKTVNLPLTITGANSVTGADKSGSSVIITKDAEFDEAELTLGFSDPSADITFAVEAYSTYEEYAVSMASVLTEVKGYKLVEGNDDYEEGDTVTVKAYAETATAGTITLIGTIGSKTVVLDDLTVSAGTYSSVYMSFEMPAYDVELNLIADASSVDYASIDAYIAYLASLEA